MPEDILLKSAKQVVVFGTESLKRIGKGYNPNERWLYVKGAEFAESGLKPGYIKKCRTKNGWPLMPDRRPARCLRVRIRNKDGSGIFIGLFIAKTDLDLMIAAKKIDPEMDPWTSRQPRIKHGIPKVFLHRYADRYCPPIRRNLRTELLLGYIPAYNQKDIRAIGAALSEGKDDTNLATEQQIKGRLQDAEIVSDTLLSGFGGDNHSAPVEQLYRHLAEQHRISRDRFDLAIELAEAAGWVALQQAGNGCVITPKEKTVHRVHAVHKMGEIRSKIRNRRLWRILADGKIKRIYFYEWDSFLAWLRVQRNKKIAVAAAATAEETRLRDQGFVPVFEASNATGTSQGTIIAYCKQGWLPFVERKAPATNQRQSGYQDRKWPHLETLKWLLKLDKPSLALNQIMVNNELRSPSVILTKPYALGCPRIQLGRYERRGVLKPKKLRDLLGGGDEIPGGSYKYYPRSEWTALRLRLLELKRQGKLRGHDRLREGAKEPKKRATPAVLEMKPQLGQQPVSPIAADAVAHLPTQVALEVVDKMLPHLSTAKSRKDAKPPKSGRRRGERGRAPDTDPGFDARAWHLVRARDLTYAEAAAELGKGVEADDVKRAVDRHRKANPADVAEWKRVGKKTAERI